jgi:hypothetical protein
MAIRIHHHATHTDDACTTHPHTHRTGYRTTRGADTYVSTHTAPTGRAYVVTTGDLDPTDHADTWDVWCMPVAGHVAPMATRYGVAITDVHPATSYVGTADGMGYASTGTDTYDAPTVVATDDTPTDATDHACIHGYGPFHAIGDAECPYGCTDYYAASFAHACGTDAYTVTDDADAPTDTPATVDADADAPTDTCPRCGAPARRMDTVATGTHVTVHTDGGNGHGGIVTRTYTGTVEHHTTDDGITYASVSLDGGGSWMTPRSDYIVHTDADMDTVADGNESTDAPTVADSNQWTWLPATDTTDRHGVRIVGAWLDAHTGDYAVHTDDGPVYADTPYTVSPTGMVPGVTYTGTSYRGTDYTAFYDGSTVMRTYADGTVTYADANHMWTTDTDGSTTTYVVAEGTYWQEVAEGTYDRVSSASWPMVATCGHSFGAYGACIAPYGHPHTDHVDANGHRFIGRAMARYDAPTGPTAPDTYVPAWHGRMGSSAPGATYRTVLTDDTYRFAAMVHAVAVGADADAFDAVTHDETMGTYRAIVGNMASMNAIPGLAVVAAIDPYTYGRMVHAIYTDRPMNTHLSRIDA